MKDFLEKVFTVILRGGVLLFVGWIILDSFNSEEVEKPPLVDTEYIDFEYESAKGDIIHFDNYEWEKGNASLGEDLKNERGGYSCNCSKTCDEIYTCEEARYQLEVCGCDQRDEDDDGTACDLMCQY